MLEFEDTIVKQFISLMNCFEIDDIDSKFEFFGDTDDYTDLKEYEKHGLVEVHGRTSPFAQTCNFSLTDSGKELVNIYVITLNKL